MGWMAPAPTDVAMRHTAGGNRRHGEQDRTDRLGRFDKERAVHAANNLSDGTWV